MTDDDRAEYRRMISNLTRLTDWLTAHGVGSDAAIRATVADHEATLIDLCDRISRLEANRGR
jgi:hypothetical protein